MDVRGRAGIEGSWRVERIRVLRWFGYVERMDEYRMASSVLIADVSGGRVQGKPRLGWMDGWREDGLGQQRDDGGGWAAMRER